jgi:hypothetical protein
MPIKPKRWSFTPVTQSTTNILAAVTPSGAGALTLDGALIVGGVLPKQELAYYLLFTTVSDESAKTVTIVGTNNDGAAQTETATALPNATTGTSVKAFRSISSITVSGALTGNLSIGTVNSTASAISPTMPLDVYCKDTVIATNISGTINFTIQKCHELVNRGQTPNWLTAEAAGAIDVVTTLTASVGAIRFLISSYTNTATIALNVNQAGYIDLN